MRTSKIYCADFETTTYKDIKETEVWASGLCSLENDDVMIDLNIDDFFKRLFMIKSNVLCYFHNLKFDGSFILNYLYRHKYNYVEKVKKGELSEHCFTTLISNTGQWYTCTLCHNGYTVEFRDSLKLLPFSLSTLATSFNLDICKGEIDYTKHRHANEVITDEEKDYLQRDVLILKNALKIMFSEGHNRLTIGSCCLSEFKRKNAMSEYGRLFPSHDDFEIHGKNADAWVRDSYRGGWCYLKKGCENIVFENGKTMDVNSLYPYVMSFDSGYKYPTGKPKVWTGDIPQFLLDTQTNKNYYFFVKIKCRFKLKAKKLPFIQIKHNYNYKSNEHLTTSDFYIKSENRYSRYKVVDGQLIDSCAELTLTESDYFLFLYCYDVFDLEVLEGAYYQAERGMFDGYISKYRKIKENSKGAQRTIAKLFSNNLYGKMATSRNSSYKTPYITESGLCFNTVYEENKSSGYIPIGSAITSHARDYTIRHAIKNYDSFIYADTDSLHMTEKDRYSDIVVHDSKYGAWKCECEWKKAIFVRQKTYVEVTKDNEYDIKACGCPSASKALVREKIKTDITLFKKGLSVGGKLIPKQIKGGVVLVETDFTIN